MTVVLVTDEWAGLGLALLMKRQGSDVVVAYDHSALDDKDLENSEICGNGLVDKVPLAGAMQKLTGKGHLWVFDSNGLADRADHLRARGEAVIGASVLSQRLEDDRDFAVEFASRAGLKVPETEKFTDYQRAVKWLQKNSGKAFVYKPDKQDPTSTYVPLDADEPDRANAELQEYLGALAGRKREGAPSFILQEVVRGHEANFDIWVRNGEPLVAFCDLESKRKMVGDLGENIGCAGGYAYKAPLESRGVRVTAGRYLSLPEVADYTGSIDANVIFTDDGEPWFLENCWRLGYNAFPAIAYGLAQWNTEDILRSWASGGESLEGAFSDDFAASLTLIVDHPKQGTPILARPIVEDHLYLYRAYKEGSLPALVSGWEEVAAVLSAGEEIHDAGESCLSLASQVSIPGVGYRVDLADGDRSTLPIARYNFLVGMALLGASKASPERATIEEKVTEKGFSRASEGHTGPRPYFRV